MRGCSSTPVPKKPVVDRLGFLLPCTIPKTVFTTVRHRVEREIAYGTCVHAVLKSSRYRSHFRVLVPSGEQVLVQVGAFDSNRKKGDIRVEMNPAKLAEGDVDAFHEVMGRIIGPNRYQSLLRKALLHRVDFAVDVVHANLSSMLVSYSNAQRFTMFGKRMDTKGHVEGYNFGSVTSDYMTAVYGKNVEQVHRAILEIAKKGLNAESLKANAIKQLHSAPPVMRVEVRGMKLSNLPLYKLRSQTNRFARFKFAYLGQSGADLPGWLENTFLSLCRECGVKAALATLGKTIHARSVRKFWNTRQCVWWKPEQLWEQACDALETLGIFPAEAFKPASTEVERVSTQHAVVVHTSTRATTKPTPNGAPTPIVSLFSRRKFSASAKPEPKVKRLSSMQEVTAPCSAPANPSVHTKRSPSDREL